MKGIGQPPDITNLGLGILLIVVIFLQAIFSAFQDWSSNKVMSSIKNMMPSQATVIREGNECKIPTAEIVPGDVVVLPYGAKVPCDVRVIETKDLKFDKSMLTGESEAVEATIDCTDETFLESKNIGFMSTLITNGQGRGICIATGRNTMIGKIATLTSETGQKKTRLQKEIIRFVIFIAILAVITVVILIIIWGAYLYPNYPNFISAPAMIVNVIGCFVAYIPTGLPVAVSLSLLLMARKMSRHRVLVKNLSTIETLSTVNVIASDKTGTLTQNRMFVANFTCNKESFVEAKSPGEQRNTPSFKQLAAVAKLCNNAHFTGHYTHPYTHI
jgi:sodium/potassium-transporting ATPase subunit alpha